MSSDNPNIEFNQSESSPVVPNKVYDWFKRSSLYILPALGAAYFAIAGIWGLPYAEQVVGTIVAVETLLGVVIRVSQKQYESSDARFDGAVILEPDYENGVTEVNVSLDPNALRDKEEVLVKVKNKT